MKLAISNLAWEEDERQVIGALLAETGITGVEIAPTKIWPTPLDVEPSEIARYRAKWAEFNIEIVAIQSILFGRPDLDIFADTYKRQQTLVHLKGMVRLAATLGARVLVFGSPSNRKVRNRAPSETQPIAVEFFHQLGGYAAQHGVTFCIEPNPVEYGCDFVTNSNQGVELVRQVDHPGFGLHLDAAGMYLAGESISKAMDDAATYLRHFHISETGLAQIGTKGVPHDEFAGALQAIDYQAWVSIEMRAVGKTSNLDHVRNAVRYAKSVYSTTTS